MTDSMWRERTNKVRKRDSNAMPKLPEKKKTVLLFFAEKDEANAYEVSEKCSLQYSTAHSSVKALEKDGLLRLKLEKINEKGVPTKVYGLTTKGAYWSIYSVSTWHEKILFAEKWQRLLKPNVVEWLKFIETLSDTRIEETLNTQIGLSVSYSDLDFFIDVIDDFFFAMVILPEMIIFHETYSKVMQRIQSYPRIKEILLKNLEEQIAWSKEDIEKQIRIKAEFEKF